MLRVTLLGNMGADPEVRYTAKGAQVTMFNVAVNQNRPGPDGERQENTEWFRVRVTGPRSEYVQQRLGKGNRVLVVGRLSISHYQARTGEQRTGFDVWADEVQGMSARPNGPESDAAGEVEAEPSEPVAAGVSSTAGAPTELNGARRRAANGRASEPAAGASGAADLEDLPF